MSYKTRVGISPFNALEPLMVEHEKFTTEDWKAEKNKTITMTVSGADGNVINHILEKYGFDLTKKMAITIVQNLED